MKTALLVIDMIGGMEEWIPRKKINKIIPKQVKLIEKARKKKIPIIYVIHTPLKNKIIYEELKPKKGDLKVDKKEYSSFYKTNLDQILKRKKIKNLLITGISTHWCILSTALDAHYRKYKITIVTDCVTAPSDNNHKQAINWMKNTIDASYKSSKFLLR